MRDIFLHTVIVVVILASFVEAGTYDLGKLLKAGLKNSHDLKIVEEEMLKADAQIMEVKGGAMPSIDLSANYQYAIKQFVPYDFDVGGMGMGSSSGTVTDALDPNEATNNDYILAGSIDGILSAFSAFGSMDFTLPKNTVSFSLSLTQPIFAQGKVLTGLKIAKSYQLGLMCKYEAKHSEVSASIIKLFYGGLLAQKNLEIQTSAVALAKETHRLTLIRFAIGKGSELDTLSSRLHLEKAEVEYQDALGGKKMAFETIIKMTGIDDNIDEMELEGNFPESEYTVGLDNAISAMYEKNRQLSQLKSAEEVQELLVKISKSDYLPMVYCGGSLGKITMFDFDDRVNWQDDQKVFLGMSMNLFSGLKRFNKVRQAQSDLRSFEQTKTQAEDGLELATRKAWEDMETAHKKLKQTEVILSLAEKGYNISKKAYEVGSQTFLDFQRAELDFNGARVALNAAKFAYHSAIVDLKVLMGELVAE